MPDGSPTTQQPSFRSASGTNRLFRERDRIAARGILDLSSDDDVVACGGPAIFGRLKAGSMPRDAAWPAGRVAVFKLWFARGRGE
jgi:hypothetical protein